MEANELRLGNYIRNMYGEVIKVDLNVIKEVSKGELFGVVQLNEELLLNIDGFRECYRSEFTINIECIKFPFIYFKWNKTFGWHLYYYGYCIPDIESLHQFQNAFYILSKGQELNVKL